MKKSRTWASPIAQTVKNPPAMQRTWVLSLGWEDPLEEGMATHSSILPCTEEPGRIQSMEFSSQNTGVGSLSLLQGIFPTQGQNPGLPHCRQIPYHLRHQGSPCQKYIKLQLPYNLHTKCSLYMEYFPIRSSHT